jgi:hypothetical protein
MTNPLHISHITDHESGATLDSGVSTCRFEAVSGGKLSRWEWRHTPPLEAISPGARHRPVPILELVDPDHGALLDHFLPLGTVPKELDEGTYRELGDFVDGGYKYQTVDTGGEVRIGLLRDGEIRSGKRVAEVRMAKSAALRPQSGDLAVLYRVINSSLRPLQVLFAVEFNLYAPGLHTSGAAGLSEGYYLIDGTRPDEPALGAAGVSPNTTHLALVNPAGEMALQLGWDRACDLWRLPSLGDGPSVRLLAVWRLQLPPRDNWAMGLWLAPA